MFDRKPQPEIRKFIGLAGLFIALTAIGGCNRKEAANKPVSATTYQGEAIAAPASDSESSATAPPFAEFTPEGYVFRETSGGDLNLDSLPDRLLVLDSVVDTSGLESWRRGPEVERLLVILVGNEDGTYAVASESGRALSCKACGGDEPDPLYRMVISKGFFSLEEAGGVTGRWSTITTFRYDKKEQDWFLYKVGATTSSRTNEEDINESLKTRKDFGVIRFSEYDPSGI